MGVPTLDDVDRVDRVSVSAGVTLARWFAAEARRVYALLTPEQLAVLAAYATYAGDAAGAVAGAMDTVIPTDGAGA